MKNKNGQVTIFIIIAILLVVGVIAYFSLRTILIKTPIPANIQPIYTTFLACFEEDTATGISILQSQGGYISLPEFEPGSEYMPFSSQLNFFGNSIPYWYYVSGNNIQKEQIPTKKNMGQQLGTFIEDRINKCNFNSYYEQGFEISLSEPEAKTTIKDNEVEVNLNANLNVSKGNESILIRNHKITVKSELGNLYDSAKKIYEEEQKNLFLEEYAVDTLRLYAPVDGVEITCSPLIWNADEVFDELQEAIEANTLAIETGIDKYFEVDLPINDEIRFLNSRNWPHSFEVTPSEGNFLIADPVGNQPGLGVIGFCYVPYHFIYNVRYPVLVQVYSGDEIFQFPMAVVIQNNNPRQSLDATASESIVPELCQYKNSEIEIKVRDKQGNPVREAHISYECFGNKCSIGKSSDLGILKENFPQCVNGYVLTSADGFRDAKYLFSTVSPGSLTVIMDKLYNKDIQLKISGVDYNGNAIIYFISDDFTKTMLYPEQRFVGLAEGQYEVHVYIYRNSSISIGETITEQCMEILKPGVLGFFGLREERCFEIEVPEQIISQALVGGGKQKYYILESELINSGVIEINTESLLVPETIEQLQTNHLLFETRGLEIEFR